MNLDDRKKLHEEIAAFVVGKTITGVRFNDPELSSHEDGMDFIFEDGTELELYAFLTDQDDEITFRVRNDAGEDEELHAELSFVSEPKIS